MLIEKKTKHKFEYILLVFFFLIYSLDDIFHRIFYNNVAKKRLYKFNYNGFGRVNIEYSPTDGW